MSGRDNRQAGVTRLAHLINPIMSPSLGRSLIPQSLKRWLLTRTRRPAVGSVDMQDLRRLRPISTSWGGDRGQPVDRYFIESFLEASAADVRGRVLEIGDNPYTVRYGGDRVTQSDILFPIPGNTKATIVADLASAPGIPSATFDCVICTQTLQLIPDIRAAVATLYRILKPGGVLLATVPTICKLELAGEPDWADYWRLTTHGARHLFAADFGDGAVRAESHGNVLVCVAFLHGLSREELTADELNYRDDAFQLLVTVRAVKYGSPTTQQP
jgi:SAM-dependent methyltransferase